MGYLTLQLLRFFETVIFAVGTHLTISVAGIFFFAFPVVFLAGAYAFTILLKAGVAFWLCVLAAAVCSLILGFFFVLLYRRLSLDSFAVFGVASILAFDALVRSWDSVTGGVLGITGISRPTFATSLFGLMIFEGVLALLVVTIEFLLLRSRFGRALQAHKESGRLLDSFGLSAKRVGSIAILICCVLVGLAGVFGAWRIQFIDPSFGGVFVFLFGLTISILAVKPRVAWMLGASAFVLLLPEVLRFLPLPLTVLGHLRMLLYSILLIILVYRLSSKYADNKRLV